MEPFRFSNSGQPFMFREISQLPAEFVEEYGKRYLRDKAVIIDDTIYCSDERRLDRIDSFITFAMNIQERCNHGVIKDWRPPSVAYEAHYIMQGGTVRKNHLIPSKTWWEKLIDIIKKKLKER